MCGGYAEALDNWWCRFINCAAFVISNLSAGPVDEFKIVHHVKRNAIWHRLPVIADKLHQIIWLEVLTTFLITGQGIGFVLPVFYSTFNTGVIISYS